jgi:hypothetical protein
MLGHRGVRLGITVPELTEMQARAILEAAVNVAEEGIDVHPEIMVPLVAIVEELRMQDELIRSVASRSSRSAVGRVDYHVGTMIELPRACLTADLIAVVAEFFSFGTNDLTQTTYGISRDDAGSFLPRYIELGLLEEDPFRVLDEGASASSWLWAPERGAPHGPTSRSASAASTAATRLGRLLPPHRPRLRFLLSLPRAHRPTGGSPGGPVSIRSAGTGGTTVADGGVRNVGGDGRVYPETRSGDCRRRTCTSISTARSVPKPSSSSPASRACPSPSTTRPPSPTTCTCRTAATWSTISPASTPPCP